MPSGTFYRRVVDDFGVSGHLTVGVLLIVAMEVMGLPMQALEVLCILFGSLLPDIDHPNSTLGRYNVLNRTRLFRHRGKCHTLIGSILLSTPFIFLGGLIPFLYVFVGCVGHLLADKLYSFGKKKKAFAIKIW